MRVVRGKRTSLVQEAQAIPRFRLKRKLACRPHRVQIAVNDEVNIHLAYLRTRITHRVRANPRTPRLWRGEILQVPTNFCGSSRKLQHVLALPSEKQTAPMIGAPVLKPLQTSERHPHKVRTDAFGFNDFRHHELAICWRILFSTHTVSVALPYRTC